MNRKTLPGPLLILWSEGAVGYAVVLALGSDRGDGSSSAVRWTDAAVLAVRGLLECGNAWEGLREANEQANNAPLRHLQAANLPRT